MGSSKRGIHSSRRGPDAYEVYGSYNDGKGQPGQSNAVSHGCPPARFRGIRVLPTG